MTAFRRAALRNGYPHCGHKTGDGIAGFLRARPTLTITQTLRHDISVYAGRDSASIETCCFLGCKTLLAHAAAC